MLMGAATRRDGTLDNLRPSPFAEALQAKAGFSGQESMILWVSRHDLRYTGCSLPSRRVRNAFPDRSGPGRSDFPA